MKIVYLLFSSLALALWGCVQSTNTTLVYVHLGKSLPLYFEASIAQARLLNQHLIIYAICNRIAFENEQIYSIYGIKFISVESLQESKLRKKFAVQSSLDRRFRDGFTYFTTERFFYLGEFMRVYKISRVVHIECDVMLYVELRELLPTLLKHYKGSNINHDTFLIN